MIVIVNYGAGNLSSIKNMLKRIGADSVISGNPEEIEKATKLILPGVGHFDFGMQQLKEAGIINILNKKVLTERIPVLGICLGVQLLTEGSEEGYEPGLGWIKGKTVAFNKAKLSSKDKVPHMGWSDIENFQHSKLFTGITEVPRFYFVHSYHLQLENTADVMAEAHYGYNFTAGIEHENILGVQFHPEKSHRFGMELLKNFIKYY